MAASSGIGRRRAAAQGEGRGAYQERRREIIDAAAQVFKKNGFTGTSIGDVAAALGTDRATLYYYVGSKNELFDEVVTEAVEANVATAEAIRDSQAPAPEKLRTLIESLIASYGEHYPFLYVFIQENLSQVAPKRSAWASTMRAHNKRYEDAVVAIVQQGYDAGSLRDCGPAWLVAYGIIGMAAWSNRWFDPSRSKAPAEQIGRTFADLVLDGLAV
jgi:AcrR family transcriptional regulator